MGGLLSSLNLGADALLAQQAGVSIAGQNTANVNTVGYSRESVALNSQAGAPISGGVLAGATSRASDSLLAAQERSQSGASGQATTLSNALNSLENSLANANVGSALGSFFGAVNQLQSAPSDSALRQQVVASAQSVANQFNAASQAISQAQSDADSSLGTMAAQATQLAAQIASLNKAIGTSNDPVLQDQRDQAAVQLAGLVGGQALTNPQGQMSFVLGNGAVLVDGNQSATVSAAASSTYGGHDAITVTMGATTRDVTTSLDGGAMAGVVQFRDGTAATAAANLDQLANDFATQVNSVTTQYQGLDGSKNLALFTGVTGTVAGSAANISVNSAIVNNTSKLPTAVINGGENDGTGATALLGLSTQNLAGGGSRSFTDQSLYIMGQVGSDTAAAASNATLQTTKSSVLASQRDSVSGVDTNQEAATLAQFQHAAEAASQYVSTVNSLLETIISNL